jgi:hypothetical protein
LRDIPDKMIHRMAGIKYMNELYESGGITSGVKHMATDIVKPKVIELSLDFGILSKYTAFIGVEEDKSGVDKDGNVVAPVLKEIPLQAPAPMRGIFSECRSAKESCCLKSMRGRSAKLSSNFSASFATVECMEVEETCIKDSGYGMPNINPIDKIGFNVLGNEQINQRSAMQVEELDFVNMKTMSAPLQQNTFSNMVDNMSKFLTPTLTKTRITPKCVVNTKLGDYIVLGKMISATSNGLLN